jgi:hypothetical protein
MAHEFRASVIVTLPDDPNALAASLATIMAGWSGFLNGIDNPGTKIESEFAVNQTRSKSPGTKRGRKPKLVVDTGGEAA